MAAESKPIILSVDDDPQVLRAIRMDLRRRYGADYRILSADSGAAGLELLEQLKQRAEVVALLLSDQRMPQMEGTRFLQQARELYPQAKRCLLTAYADISAAIEAINSVGLDYYLSKPWDPPEEKLFPILDDLLDDWQCNFIPERRGIQVWGFNYEPRAHAIKSFLANNLVPYVWNEAPASGAALPPVLAKASLKLSDLPACMLEDGTVLIQPDIPKLAASLGMHQEATDELYDVAIIGAGPAGLAAAVYGGSEGLRTVIIERHAPGGQAGTSSRIENYLGFPSGISGADLSRRALSQALRFGVELLSPKEVTRIEAEGPVRRISFSDGSCLRSKAIVLTTGVDYRALPAGGAERFQGAGVYYGAATAEAGSCTDRQVAIVGGGNSAGQAAVYLSRFARQVKIFIRRADLRDTMSSYLIDQIASIPNIEVLGHREIRELQGDQRLEAMMVEDLQRQEEPRCYREEVDALFVFIGARPHTSWLDGALLRDEKEFLLTGRSLQRHSDYARSWKHFREPWLLETSMPGVFAAGDVRSGAMNRVASAVGEGAMAIKYVHQYLSEL